MINCKHITFLSLFILFQTVSGQNLDIVVRDKGREALVGATVVLTNVESSKVDYKTTNQNGIAKFENIELALYQLKISFIGFETLERSISVKQNTKRLNFTLEPSVLSLGEVAVVARRPLMRQEDDKTIVDPEPIAETSSSTLEVLENTPGVYVDQDGGVFLNGATPAAIYINGRAQKMSNQDISSLLRSLPPGSIQHIEILRTPSTKYDASSSGGIVNIVLKKGIKLGRFVAINAGANQGIYGNRFAGINMNFGADKTAMYVNTNYNYNDALEETNTMRFFSGDTALIQSAKSRRFRNQGFIGYGLNHSFNDNSDLSYDGRINLSFPKTTSENNNQIIFSPIEVLGESNDFVNGNSIFLNIQQDLSYNLKLDSLGSIWENKFGFNHVQNRGEDIYKNDFTYPFLAEINSESDNLQKRNFIQLQSDLTLVLPHKIKLETGLKSSLQYFNSKSEYNFIQNEQNIFDSLKSNTFNYQERINSIYLQASKTLWFNLVLKMGVRMEHTYMAGNQTFPAETNYVVNRPDWFPYLFLSRKLFKLDRFEIRAFMIYRKTIQRPDYQNLNPYSRYLDNFMYERGNPSLKPQFSENIELNISVDEMPLFAVGQNYTTDIFSSVMYTDSNNRAIAVRTYDNLGKSKETYLRGMLGIPPGRRYFFGFGAQFNLNEYQGFYDGLPFNYTNGTWRFFTYHSLKITKTTKLTMMGFMMTKGQYSFLELDDFGMLNFGLSQSFLNNRLVIILNARDVLGSMDVNFKMNHGNVPSYGSRIMDTRRIGLNIRYNFGIKLHDEKKKFMNFEEELSN